VVNPSLPVKNVNELIALARAKPGQLNFASGGIASFNQLCAELLKMSTKIEIVHVPYKGGGPAVADLVGGKVDMLFTGAPVTMSHIKSGRLKVLAVTDSQRSAALPDTPTMGESVPGYEFNNWYGIMAPAGTPRPVVDKVAADVKRIYETSEVQAKLKEIGATPRPMSPDEFAEFSAAERRRYLGIVKAAGMQGTQ
jgi:tripartite-type tricarboxylate transporter receptor subunit TctC